jgi:hypothetical protein
MPTVMMMMILGMRSRDGLLYCPCNCPAVSGQREGSKWGPSSGPSAKTYSQGVGKTNTAPAGSPYGSQFAPFYGPLMERK